MSISGVFIIIYKEMDPMKMNLFVNNSSFVRRKCCDTYGQYINDTDDRHH